MINFAASAVLIARSTTELDAGVPLILRRLGILARTLAEHCQLLAGESLTELMRGADLRFGRGMTMLTSCSSSEVLHSYSKLTKDSPPELDGQQLMVIGT